MAMVDRACTLAARLIMHGCPGHHRTGFRAAAPGTGPRSSIAAGDRGAGHWQRRMVKQRGRHARRWTALFRQFVKKDCPRM